MRSAGGLKLIFLWLSLAAIALAQKPCPELARSLADLKAEHAKYSLTDAKANQHYYSSIKKLPKKGKMVFTVENAYLKQLNERVFSDREISQATTNIYKKLFMAELTDSPMLKHKLHALYSDYKGIRIVFEEDSPEMARAVNAIFEKVALQFAQALEQYPQVMQKIEAKDGVLAQPHLWFHGGFGKTHDSASAKARLSRYQDLSPGRAPPLGRFEELKTEREFLQHVAQAEVLRRQIQEMFPDSTGVTEAVKRGSPQSVLSPTALSILAKASSVLSENRLNGKANYLEYTETRFKEHFGIIPTHSQITTLQAYFHTLNLLAPSLFLRDPVIVDLTDAPDGVIWVDVSGQNSRNLGALSRALYKANKMENSDREKLSQDILKEIRKGQSASSRDFEFRISRFKKAVEKAGLQGDKEFSLQNGIKFSGDEGAFAAKAPISSSEFSRVVHHLAQLSSGSLKKSPAEFRLVYLESLFTQSKTRMPKEDKSLYMKHAETLEKQLRENLAHQGVSNDTLKKVLFGIEVRPVNSENTDVELVIGGEVGEGTLKTVGDVFQDIAKDFGWSPVGIRRANP